LLAAIGGQNREAPKQDYEWAISGDLVMNNADAGNAPTMRYGIDPFDVGYGASFAAEADSPFDVECELVEDGGTLRPHSPEPGASPARLAFVDGTMRTDARLTRTDAGGIVYTGLAGSWAAGAVVADAGLPLTVRDVVTERVAIFCGSVPVTLPAQPGGWSWAADSIDAVDLGMARQRLQRRMRDGEARLAEELCSAEWLTVVDGPLNNIRRTRALPIVGYVKTHHRRLLDHASWTLIPQLGAGQRSSAFALGDELYGCYLRVGDPGPWASPWAGIVRLEVPAGAGRQAAIGALDAAASWLPRYASAAHRDKRAPVNLTPIAGLERQLRRRSGDARLALRAVRDAVTQLNSMGDPS
jgi:hypothetical protein